MKPLAGLVMLLALGVVAAACSMPAGRDTDTTVPVEQDARVIYATATPTPLPLTAGLPPLPTATPATENLGIRIVGAHWGAATASIEERIYTADIVVHAELLSTSTGILNFQAIEYLKGTGPRRFSVAADTAGRSTQWDDDEAVLFLDSGSSSSSSTRASSSSSSFTFTDTTQWIPRAFDSVYSGSLPEGYTVGSRNPVWLPIATGGSTSQSTAGTVSESISLTNLRTKVAWVTGGAGVDGYGECIRWALWAIRDYRDWGAYHGSTDWKFDVPTGKTMSGQGAGAVLRRWTSGWPAHPTYSRLWLSGPDADLFAASILDDDSVPGNGHDWGIVTARPLPSGTYRVFFHEQQYRFFPCNYIPPRKVPYDLTVTSSGAVHEAFFDPVAIGTGFGADGTNGALKPTAFTVGGSSTALSSLKWQGGSVVLKLSPYAALTGQTLDVIAIDGALALSLAASAATVDSTAGTLTWSVASQPWRAGDKLMLRLR